MDDAAGPGACVCARLLSAAARNASAAITATPKASRRVRPVPQVAPTIIPQWRAVSSGTTAQLLPVGGERLLGIFEFARESGALAGDLPALLVCRKVELADASGGRRGGESNTGAPVGCSPAWKLLREVIRGALRTARGPGVRWTLRFRGDRAANGKSEALPHTHNERRENKGATTKSGSRRKNNLWRHLRGHTKRITIKLLARTMFGSSGHSCKEKSCKAAARQWSPTIVAARPKLLEPGFLPALARRPLQAVGEA